jgi:hypothetical protein
MTSSTTYRAIFPISLAAIALVALWGYTQHSSTPRLQLSVPIEVIDTNAEHPRRLASKPNVNLRGIFEDSADRKAKERQHGTERRTKECLPPLPPPPLPGKKGIGFTLREEGMLGSWVENIPKVVALNPYWNYSWGSKRVEAQPDNIEFVPMLWGAWGETGFINRIVSDIYPQIQSGQAKRVLGFNKPDYERSRTFLSKTSFRTAKPSKILAFHQQVCQLRTRQALGCVPSWERSRRNVFVRNSLPVELMLKSSRIICG